jgi:hypothetical protein
MTGASWPAAVVGALILAGGPLAGGLGCATPRPPAPGSAAWPSSGGAMPAAAAREALAQATRAMRAGRWIDAWTLLSARWRAATTPGRLAAGYAVAGSAGREAVERVLALLGSGAPLVEPAPGRLELPLGPGRTARLVAEGGVWRVDSLE